MTSRARVRTRRKVIRSVCVKRWGATGGQRDPQSQGKRKYAVLIKWSRVRDTGNKTFTFVVISICRDERKARRRGPEGNRGERCVRRADGGKGGRGSGDHAVKGVKGGQQQGGEGAVAPGSLAP